MTTLEDLYYGNITPNILNELVDRIEVYQAEKTERGKVQKLVIYYNCIGSIYLPEDSSPPIYKRERV